MTEHHASPGPYDSETEARGAVAHILASPPESRGDGNRRLLEDALRAAGVELGAFDHQVLVWLAGFEPATVAVVAGWADERRRHPPSPLEELLGPAGVAMPSPGGMISGPMGGTS